MNNEFEQPEDVEPDNAELDRDDLDSALDGALVRWGAERTSGPEHLDQLRDRVVDELRSQLPAPEIQPQNQLGNRKTNHPAWNNKWWLAVAALIVLAFSVSWMMRTIAPNSIATNPNDVAEEAEIAAIQMVTTDFDQQKILLERFQEFFGSDIRYVSDVDGDVEIELNNDPFFESATDPEFLSVRLVLISREVTSASNKWKMVRDISLLANRERRVELPSSQGDMEFSMWAFPVDENLVSIDLRCRLDGPLKMDISTSELQKSGQSEKIFSTTKDGIEYRLYQTAIRLSPDGDDGLGERRDLSKTIDRLSRLEIPSSRTMNVGFAL